MFLDFCLLHKGAVLPRHAIFCTLVFVCLHLILFVSNLCDLLSITILIFFTSNHIISLKQTNLVFGHFDLKFSLRVLLSVCLIFCQFEPGFPYKMLLIKKVYLSLQNNNYSLFSWKNGFCKLFKLFMKVQRHEAGWPTKETKQEHSTGN